MHLAVLGLSRKFPTMARKFNSENYILNTQRHRDTEIISNTENSERTETFVYYFPVVSGSSTNLRAFRVQKKCGVIVGVILFFKKFLTPSITPLRF